MSVLHVQHFEIPHGPLADCTYCRTRNSWWISGYTFAAVLFRLAITVSGIVKLTPVGEN